MLNWTFNSPWINTNLILSCPASKDQANQDALDNNTMQVAGLLLAGG